jgi:ribosome biogenesis protein SSF1/2
MPRRGGKRKKAKTHQTGGPEGANVMGEGAIKDDVPRSIVAKASKVIPQVQELVRDVRKMMAPYTASKLREKKDNKLRDYVSVAGQLGVSHLLTFSQTKDNVVFRVARSPTGPTLHMKCLQYTLCSQVKASQRRPFDSAKAYLTPPLVVLNNFGQTEASHVNLMKVTFQHMFPAINIKTVKLAECRRVVLFHYNREDGSVDFRHYAIRAQPVGISRSVKKILQAKVPDLSKLEDVSEFLEGHGMGAASDSEAEDEGARVSCFQMHEFKS